MGWQYQSSNHSEALFNTTSMGDRCAEALGSNCKVSASLDFIGFWRLYCQESFLRQLIWDFWKKDCTRQCQANVGKFTDTSWSSMNARLKPFQMMQGQDLMMKTLCNMPMRMKARPSFTSEELTVLKPSLYQQQRRSPSRGRNAICHKAQCLIIGSKWSHFGLRSSAASDSFGRCGALTSTWWRFAKASPIAAALCALSTKRWSDSLLTTSSRERSNDPSGNATLIANTRTEPCTGTSGQWRGCTSSPLWSYWMVLIKQNFAGLETAVLQRISLTAWFGPGFTLSQP